MIGVPHSNEFNFYEILSKASPSRKRSIATAVFALFSFPPSNQISEEIRVILFLLAIQASLSKGTLNAFDIKIYFNARINLITWYQNGPKSIKLVNSTRNVYSINVKAQFVINFVINLFFVHGTGNLRRSK